MFVVARAALGVVGTRIAEFRVRASVDPLTVLRRLCVGVSV